MLEIEALEGVLRASFRIYDESLMAVVKRLLEWI